MNVQEKLSWNRGIIKDLERKVMKLNLILVFLVHCYWVLLLQECIYRLCLHCKHFGSWDRSMIGDYRFIFVTLSILEVNWGKSLSIVKQSFIFYLGRQKRITNHVNLAKIILHLQVIEELHKGFIMNTQLKMEIKMYTQFQNFKLYISPLWETIGSCKII